MLVEMQLVMNSRNTKKERKLRKKQKESALMTSGEAKDLVPLELSLWQALYLNKHHNLFTKCLNLFFDFPFTQRTLPTKLNELLTEYLAALSFQSADSIDYDTLDNSLSQILIGCSIIAKFLSNKDSGQESADRIAMAEQVIEKVWNATWNDIKGREKTTDDAASSTTIGLQLPANLIEGC